MSRDGARTRAVRWGLPAAAAMSTAALLACHPTERPAEHDLVLAQRFAGLTIAVAPALNQSGSREFDADRVADVMASELGQLGGIQVVPVSRVLAILAGEGRLAVESGDHASGLVEVLGVDAILVFAITEYDPYLPPVVGITAQLYGRPKGSGGSTVDPVRLAHSGSGGEQAAAAEPDSPLLAQWQRVFDASDGRVLEEVRRFAEKRGAAQSAFGWRRYVASQQEYLRFVCHRTLRGLLGVKG